MVFTRLLFKVPVLVLLAASCGGNESVKNAGLTDADKNAMITVASITNSRMTNTAVVTNAGNATNARVPTADEIVRNIDGHRSLSLDFNMTIRLENFRNGQFEDATVLKCYVSGGKISTLVYLEPDSMRGRKILIDGNDMWIVIPNVKNPIRITPSQKLLGGISFGDVARVGYADDYNARLVGEEVAEGMKPDWSKDGPKKCYVVGLTAKNGGLTYYRITLWVDEEIFLPVKADFFALSGKKMLTAYYSAPKEFDRKVIITKMFLYDQINTSRTTSMEYLDMKPAKVSN